MLIKISKIQFIGTQKVKSFNKPCGHEAFASRPNRLHVTTHSHELMSLVSINCVNNIECFFWSRSHNLSATHCLPRVLTDLFLGQCHQVPLLLPLGLHLNHLKPLSATVTLIALIRFISHLLKHQDL